ncbi:ALG6/ALG8 family glucosyltransferase xit isoform X2 [Lycorma delicatula]|uniref:ALG6/ALG8 family glucosyltransferase xit isoform X2 n=1 Tax=Lycorma delicatula TaxID=130591 RepID=UPI003F5163B5
MFWRIVLMISCFKLLLIPSYRSTDFEVHRNWLAITHSLPIDKWYYESTSEWTLDYPPLFAWFEFLLSHIAKYFDSKMLNVHNLNYTSTATILFQRLSVIFSDIILAYGTKECCMYLSTCGVRKSSKWSSRWGSPTAILQLLLLGNAGLLMVDHIHFQYNGLLFGILLLSVARTMQDHWLEGAFWFTILLNMKHIYLYIAPAYFIYYLRNYCFTRAVPGEPLQLNSFSVVRLVKLSIIVLSVFIISFGPFIACGQVQQVLSRLFPFKRGLCHAYWAPNFWALYNTADKILVTMSRLGGLNVTVPVASMTGGLVQEFQHSVLPVVSPRTTLVCTLLSILPCLVKLWKCPGNPLHFMRSLIICASGAFMFGWHVHEKAILMVIIPLSVMAVVWRKEAEIYLMMSTVGHYSLFPLLFTPFEQIIKVCYLLLEIYSFTGPCFSYGQNSK